MMTDPVADMLTRIRNAIQIERPFVDIPYSKLKKNIAEALQREGYIWDFEVIEQAPQNVLRVNLKYGPNGERVIQFISRKSKPGCWVYSKIKELTEILDAYCRILILARQLGNVEYLSLDKGRELLAMRKD